MQYSHCSNGSGDHPQPVTPYQTAGKTGSSLHVMVVARDILKSKPLWPWIADICSSVSCIMVDWTPKFKDHWLMWHNRDGYDQNKMLSHPQKFNFNGNFLLLFISRTLIKNSTQRTSCSLFFCVLCNWFNNGPFQNYVNYEVGKKRIYSNVYKTFWKVSDRNYFILLNFSPSLSILTHLI